ncbi:MAG: DUF349 domain-containing protein [Rikenellaceae bacterium]
MENLEQNLEEQVTQTQDVEQTTAEQTPEKVEAETAPVTEETQAETAQKNLAEMNLEELTAQLASDIENRPITELKERVEEIKVVFYKKIKAADEKDKVLFVLNGGIEDEFKAEVRPEEVRFKELLALYRDNRNKVIAQSEEQKEENYKAKLQIVEELKALVNSSETMGATFAAFKALQERWREIGAVPLGVTKDLWETYHHHTENFYNYVKINRELRDLDLKRNYEVKLAICEKAEALSQLQSAVTAFNELQKLHEEYRESGPVALEVKEELWERFKVASSVVNKRHQEHYDSLRAAQEENLEKKAAICSAIEEMVESVPASAKGWNEMQEKITAFQAEWKTIGFAPKKDNTAIYERFRAACDKFFAAKREFFNSMKGDMQTNLDKKTALCEKAEELSLSEDYKDATEQIIALQKEWKTVGVVPRKYSDALWIRFRAACDKFFERKGEHFKDANSSYAQNLVAKQAIIEELRALYGTEELSFDKLKEVMGRFSAIGFVANSKKDALMKEYKEVCDTLFNSLRKREGSEQIERYRQRFSGAAKEGGAANSERDKLYTRLRNLEAEARQLNNNIGFFANSKGVNPLKQEVERKIEKINSEIAQVKEKIKIVE